MESDRGAYFQIESWTAAGLAVKNGEPPIVSSVAFPMDSTCPAGLHFQQAPYGDSGALHIQTFRRPRQTGKKSVVCGMFRVRLVTD